MRSHICYFTLGEHGLVTLREFRLVILRKCGFVVDRLERFAWIISSSRQFFLASVFVAGLSRYERGGERAGVPLDIQADVDPLDAPAPSTPSVRDSIHPVQFGIFPNRLLLPHLDDEILPGYEEDVSSIRDGYTAWVKVDPASTLERHLVSLGSANPIFREAQDRRHSSPNSECRFHNDVTDRLREQRRLRVLSWNR